MERVFRCILFFNGMELYLRSRDLRPLGRYFPNRRARRER